MNNNRFICMGVSPVYPDASERINSIVSQIKPRHRLVDWKVIKSFIATGNLVYVILDNNINDNLQEKIVAVAFYSFSETLFDGLVCSEDIYTDSRYKKGSFNKHFWKEIRDRIISRRVSKIISKFRSKNDLKKDGYTANFVQILESPKKV